MDEHWEVLKGTAVFRITGTEVRAMPGDIVLARAGEPHAGWNPTDKEVHLRVQMRPALRWQEFMERLFRLAEQGRVNEDGVPFRDEMVRLLADFPDEIAAPRKRD